MHPSAILNPLFLASLPLLLAIQLHQSLHAEVENVASRIIAERAADFFDEQRRGPEQQSRPSCKFQWRFSDSSMPSSKGLHALYSLVISDVAKGRSDDAQDNDCDAPKRNRPVVHSAKTAGNVRRPLPPPPLLLLPRASPKHNQRRGVDGNARPSDSNDKKEPSRSVLELVASNTFKETHDRMRHVRELQKEDKYLDRKLGWLDSNPTGRDRERQVTKYLWRGLKLSQKKIPAAQEQVHKPLQLNRLVSETVKGTPRVEKPLSPVRSLSEGKYHKHDEGWLAQSPTTYTGSTRSSWMSRALRGSSSESSTGSDGSSHSSGSERSSSSSSLSSSSSSNSPPPLSRQGSQRSQSSRSSASSKISSTSRPRKRRKQTST